MEYGDVTFTMPRAWGDGAGEGGTALFDMAVGTVTGTARTTVAVQVAEEGKSRIWTESGPLWVVLWSR